MIQQHFKAHLSELLPLPNGEVLVAVSGGVDSMVLLDLLQQQEIRFSVAHCNFQLRETESLNDELFVENYCTQNNIKFFVKRFDTLSYAKTHNISIQMAARLLRYAWFEALQNTYCIPYLFTAHHLDDSLETFLINLSRGTGIDGLLGINNTEKIIRPLLIFSKEEILNYALQQRLEWREDSSNSSDKYLRNNIRHHIVPKLKELNPYFLQAFQKSIAHLAQTNNFADEMYQKILNQIITTHNQCVSLNIKQLLEYTNYQYILFSWLQPYGFTAWNDIYNLVHSNTGKQIFSSEYTLLKNRNELLLFPIQKDSETVFINSLDQNIEKPLKLFFSEVTDLETFKDKNVIFIDKSLLNFPIIIEKYKESDYFYPFGMQGKKKKISKFFKDEKLSILEKQNTWILKSKGEVVWVVGRRQDERFKVTEQTKHIIKVEYLL